MDELTQISPRNPNSVQHMFSSIARRYDLANSVLSLGIHHLWKRKLVRRSGGKRGDRVLDCATGTGDLAFLFDSYIGNGENVLGCDFCQPMLNIAKEKAQARKSSVRFEQADLLQLPYSDAYFDIVSISFGIRNVKDPVRAISEMSRVTKPGGRILILEFGQPDIPFLRQIYKIYSHSILPRIGGWISGQKKAYDYLKDTSATFPCGTKFLKLASASGKFSEMRSQALFGGVAYLYQLELR